MKGELDEQQIAELDFDTINFDNYFDWLETMNKNNKKNLIKEPAHKKAKTEKDNLGSIVGAANPYVIASVVLDKPIADLKSSDLVSAMKTLGGADVESYQDIFNPAKNSPIFNMDSIDLSRWIAYSKPLRQKPLSRNFFTVLKKELSDIRIHHEQQLEERIQVAEKFLFQDTAGKKKGGGGK